MSRGADDRAGGGPTGEGAARLSGFAAELAARAAAESAADSAGSRGRAVGSTTTPSARTTGRPRRTLLRALLAFRAGRCRGRSRRRRPARRAAPHPARSPNSATAARPTTACSWTSRRSSRSSPSPGPTAGPFNRSSRRSRPCVAGTRSRGPVPVEGVRVALAAASEGTELVVLDPTSETEFVVRRPALWAIARAEPWVPADRDPEVREAFAASIASELGVHAVALLAGDPEARLAARRTRRAPDPRRGPDRELSSTPSWPARPALGG